MKKSWLCVEIPCVSPLADQIAAEIAAAFGVGVEITDSGIRFYLEGDRFQKDWADLLDGLLSEFAKWVELDSPLTFDYHSIADGDWTDRWKEGFKPLRVGRHFVVSPTWEEAAAGPDDLVIRIDPGRAFGTGHHETTRLCLEWLEKRAASEPGIDSCSLLDVGTGSGILAMGAALLGFGRIVGIDNDPVAIEVADANVRLNGLAGKVQLRLDTVAGPDHFDVIIANIQANPLIAMAEGLAKRLKKAGQLVLSGILVEQKEQVKTAYQTAGLHQIHEKTDGEWCLLVFERRREVAQNDE